MYEMHVKKIKDDAVLPFKAHASDAGFDVFSIEETDIKPKEFKLIKTGIAIELPEGTEAQIRSRSGLALKNGIAVLNSPGTIDAGYRGEIGVILINHSNEVFHVEKYMKIAQMVIQQLPVFELIHTKSDLELSDRGKDGFGSTGLTTQARD